MRLASFSSPAAVFQLSLFPVLAPATMLLAFSRACVFRQLWCKFRGWVFLTLLCAAAACCCATVAPCPALAPSYQTGCRETPKVVILSSRVLARPLLVCSTSAAGRIPVPAVHPEFRVGVDRLIDLLTAASRARTLRPCAGWRPSSQPQLSPSGLRHTAASTSSASHSPPPLISHHQAACAAGRVAAGATARPAGRPAATAAAAGRATAAADRSGLRPVQEAPGAPPEKEVRAPSPLAPSPAPQQQQAVRSSPLLQQPPPTQTPHLHSTRTPPLTLTIVTQPTLVLEKTSCPATTGALSEYQTLGGIEVGWLAGWLACEFPASFPSQQPALNGRQRACSPTEFCILPSNMLTLHLHPPLLPGAPHTYTHQQERVPAPARWQHVGGCACHNGSPPVCGAGCGFRAGSHAGPGQPAVPDGRITTTTHQQQQHTTCAGASQPALRPPWHQHAWCHVMCAPISTRRARGGAAAVYPRSCRLRSSSGRCARAVCGLPQVSERARACVCVAHRGWRMLPVGSMHVCACNMRLFNSSWWPAL